MEPLTPSGKPRFDGMGQYNLGLRRRRRRRRGDLAGDAAAAAAALDGQARLADRARTHGTVGGVVRAVLPIRRSPVLLFGRRAAGHRRPSPLRSDIYQTRFAETIRRTEEVSGGISDLQFTDAYRVPFQYGAFLRQHLKFGAFVQSSEGVTITDLDGNRFYDLTGSYGVNVLGYDFYKEAIAQGVERVRELGPVLGSYHPVIADNVRRLQEISGLDEVSFHMSGTEAVMQAVRLARSHTRP